ncbi:glycosyltransferase [Candidatus Berkelbacteria bacterium CG10_big_fil_rev_8_21_14_0_10_43_13]|uniref:Glycosyltransferase n=1 Tax=Candidatus Berkelbacteria bacterium CG10_big_fil_rev_8_21_14_0_10_43_13 TaxID=1974514 RepID=A0A2H0W5U8_9BACT|nr:MAG: glycosyltransferase [Candidatus Berkelbacteria bacterium CG10_big_fil_rev_8_21_14_0_10_43_13]
MTPKYSIIIPAYNEAESLPELWRQIDTVMKKISSDFEVVFIDDGSRDGTAEVAKKLSEKNKEIKLIHFLKNSGKAAALQAGFRAATGDFIVTMDADLQDDPAEIPNLKKKIDEGYDLVSGYKKNRHDPIHKTIPSHFFNFMVRRVSGLRLHDINCGLKMYRHDVVKSLNVYGELYRFIPILAASNGYRVGEIAVNHRPRKFGVSKYGFSRFLRGFLDLFTVIFLTKFIKRPLHLFGSIGLLFLAIGIVISGWMAYIHTFLLQSVGDRPLFLFGILFIIAGVQLIATGLIGELITHYYHLLIGNGSKKE